MFNQKTTILTWCQAISIIRICCFWIAKRHKRGIWHLTGGDGVDHYGCINMLTSQRPSPLAKGNPQHTNLVQVEKAGKQS
jgi:anaerobic selenocysteine-containing dehydrogenase